jgi:hypothetical protein
VEAHPRPSVVPTPCSPRHPEPGTCLQRNQGGARNRPPCKHSTQARATGTPWCAAAVVQVEGPSRNSPDSVLCAKTFALEPVLGLHPPRPANLGRFGSRFEVILAGASPAAPRELGEIWFTVRGYTSLSRGQFHFRVERGPIHELHEGALPNSDCRRRREESLA